MLITTPNLHEKATQPPPPSSPYSPTERCPNSLKSLVLPELRKQAAIVLPLAVTNIAWFAKIAITTAFLGHLGELQLAGGALGFTFANVTGFSVLTGLCGAMEPVCGQAYGAGNHKLLHKTLFMTTLLLLLATLPISFLWLNIDKILIYFGQRDDISIVAKSYVRLLIPDLLVTSFLCPLKAYLSSQTITAPIVLSSALGLALHVPANILLSKAKGLEGVAIAVWTTDLIVVILLSFYVLAVERWGGGRGRWEWGGWWDQGLADWLKLLRLCGPCCLTTCLEWWCYEILVLIAGHLTDPTKAVSVLAVVLNFDYLLYSLMLSQATSVSTRVSNELGANDATAARASAYVSLLLSVFMGLVGGSVMVFARGLWSSLYSKNEGIVRGVKRMMLLMALVEVVNFPLAVGGGIVRGTARPSLAMYANLGGFYLLALPLGVVLAFRVRMGLGGLLLGFLAGVLISAVLLIIMVLRVNWTEEAAKAQKLVRTRQEGDEDPSEIVATVKEIRNL